MAEKKRVLLAPLDPVHDIGLKMIKRGLEQAGHETILLPPDYSVEEVVQAIAKHKASTVLISRTLGYGVAELLAKFVDPRTLRPRTGRFLRTGGTPQAG